MKNAILILLLIPFGINGQVVINQTDTKSLKQGFWQKEYPNGKPVYQGYFVDDKPVGEWKRFYETGSLKAHLLYDSLSNRVKARLFDPSGKPVAEGSYTSETKTGPWIYFADGIKIAEENFLNGKKNGICRKFYPSGQLLEESEWKDDQLDGKYRAFFNNGKPYLECLYKSGQRNGYCISYFPSGSVETEGYYENDLPERFWKFLDEKGNTRFELIYKKGILRNPEVIRKINTQELDELEKQRDRLIDPEKYLQNPEEFLSKKKVMP